jgi:uncharacterized repeat protein (TIGR01451 family)
MKKLFFVTGLILSAASAFASGHVATAIGTNPTCYGMCNGSAVAYASGGVGPYGYTWTGPSGYTGAGQNISGLCAGTYVVNAIDSSDMSSAYYTINLSQPSMLVCTTGGGSSVCSGSSTTIIVAPSGGTPAYSYSWAPATGLSATNVSSPTATPLSTTTYTATVTDANGCTTTGTITVTVNASPVVTVNSPTICAGGFAVLTASGATTYNWSTGTTSNPYTVTPASTTTYTVTGTTSGCSATALSTVTVNPPDNASFFYSSSIYCISGPNPTPTIGGGTAGTFSASPAGLVFASTSTGQIILSASTLGSYTVTYTTSGPCPNSNSVAITITNSPSAAFSYAGPYCSSGGMVSPTYSAGGSPGVFSSTAGLAINTSTGEINLAASSPGTYTVTNSISAAGGCAATSSTATVTINAGPIVTVSPSAATCTACNGSITTSAPGGTTFSWSGPSGYTSTTVNPSGLCTGTYTLSATNGGCVSTLTTTVGTSSPVVATIGSVMPSSCTACTGSATVYVTGGTPPYSYMWSPTGGTTATVTNLCPAIYYVTVTDNNGCSFTTSATIPAAATITPTVTAGPTACGACNGTANVTASGGTGPYTYDWIPGTPTGDGTVSISNLCAGTYSAIVTDANGCSGTAGSTVNSTNPVYGTASYTSSACGLCNGTVSVLESGGVGPFLYDLSNGSPQQTNGNFSGVCAGTYVATVTDANGCIGTYTVTVPATNTATFTVSDLVQNETGAGLNNGSINLTISGSTAPYTFLWNNGATTEDIYSLAAGSYNVTITDNAGNCGTYYFNVGTTSSYGYITGYAYSDLNANCSYDAGDVGLAGYYVFATNGTSTYYGYTGVNGYYMIWVPAGNYTITPASWSTANLEGACINTYSTSITAGSTSANNNFSYVIPPVYDVCTYVWSSGIVPGFNGNYYVYLYNAGNMPATGVVYLVLPGLLNYVSSAPAASSISGDTIFWNYTNILPYSYGFFYVTFNTPPTAVLGTPVIAYANATVTNGTDINPACNNYVYTRIVSGSFDPNEKTVSPSGSGPTGDIPLSEEEFTYLVRFQNTGSGPAVNISITDTLSPLLDIMSFEMLDASDMYNVEFLPGNVVKWSFDNIMLPDSTSDEAGSHGHVQFRIHKLNAPVAGQVIENKAYIYFDFNAPVITSTAINTYNLAAAVEEEMNKNGSVGVYPNPFSDQTTFVIRSDKTNETYSFEMTDMLGRNVRTAKNISEKQFSISRNELQSGMYFYKITNENGVVGTGKLIIK